MLKRFAKFSAAVALAATFGLGLAGSAGADSKLLNVSDDPTRELYKA